MEAHEYERLAAAEERAWWFRGLHANLLAAWRARADDARAARVLDAGCGTGGFLKRLAPAAHGAFCCGVELDRAAAVTAAGKSGAAIVAGQIERLPFPDRSFDAVFSADVLCHRGVDEALALAEFRRCLRPRGVLVLNLPAYRWLYSAHDVAVANARRYGAREVRRALEGAGFAEPRLRHWNAILFPLMVMRRKILPSAPGRASDVELLPSPLERLFHGCVALEAALAACGLGLPFGGSILATAVRP
ncbi:MAG TPA: class I SAM-dependent methyltransferase [Stellaceae bacterium]|nr:class I SAM-dependent methyltransferase [Stellaceae bacterium]